MSNIVDYKIVEFFSKTGGDPVANELPEWQPYGNPMKSGNNIQQAMVRYAEDSVTQPIMHEAAEDRYRRSKPPAKKKAAPKKKATPKAAPADDTPSPYAKLNPQ